MDCNLIDKYLAKGEVAENPELLIDGPKVTAKYHEFEKALPETDFYFAVKALTNFEILKALEQAGSRFDCASIDEITIVRDLFGTVYDAPSCAAVTAAVAARICYGNTIKSDFEIKYAYDMGVRLMVTDSIADVKAIAEYAPGCEVYCRFITRGGVFGDPYSNKFGCDEETALEVLKLAHAKGLKVRGVSFHVGTQKLDVAVWDAAIEIAARIFVQMKEQTGVTMDLVNMGGAFPATYNTTRPIPPLAEYAATIKASLAKHFAGWAIKTMIEPGRSLVGDAGMLIGRVKNVSRCAEGEPLRVFLNIGTYHGLRETKPDAFVPYITTLANVGVKTACHLYGPSCDGTDFIAEQTFRLPANIKRNDIVIVHNWGAYSGYNTTFNSLPAPVIKVLWE